MPSKAKSCSFTVETCGGARKRSNRSRGSPPTSDVQKTSNNSLLHSPVRLPRRTTVHQRISARFNGSVIESALFSEHFFMPKKLWESNFPTRYQNIATICHATNLLTTPPICSIAFAFSHFWFVRHFFRYGRRFKCSYSGVFFPAL